MNSLIKVLFFLNITYAYGKDQLNSMETTYLNILNSSEIDLNSENKSTNSINSTNTTNSTTSTNSTNSTTSTNTTNSTTSTNSTELFKFDSIIFNENNAIFMKNLMLLSKKLTNILSQIGIIDLLKSISYCYNEMCPNTSNRDNIIRIIYGQINNINTFVIGDVIFKISHLDLQNKILIGNHGPIQVGLFIKGNYIYYGAGIHLDWKILQTQQSKVFEILSNLNPTSNTVLII